MLTAGSAEEWADIVSRSYVALATDGVAPNFHAAIDKRQCGEIAISRVRAKSTRLLRTDRLISSAPADDVLLSLPVVSGGAVCQADRTAEFVAGSGVFYEADAPYSLEFPVGADQWVVQVPRLGLSGSRRQIRNSVGRQLDPAAPTLRLARRMVAEVLALTQDELAEDGARVGQALVLLVDSLFDAAAGSREESRAAMYEILTADIRANLTEHALSSNWLARRHQISVRYLQALFAEYESSPAAYIRAERLRQAHRVLGDPLNRASTIAEIAVGVGFSDQTTFTRAFRAQYGCSPGEHRREMCADRR